MNWTRNNQLVYVIPLVVLAAKIIEFLLQSYEIEIDSSAEGNLFVSNFIEWFGVIYGLLLPLVMVKVWEQLDAIDREFDREADAVKALYEDIFFLQGKCAEIGKDIVPLLREYVIHVIGHYPLEVKSTNDSQNQIDNASSQSELNQSPKKTQVSNIAYVMLLETLQKRLTLPIDAIMQRWNKIRNSNERIQHLTSMEGIDDPKKFGDNLLDGVRKNFRNFFLPRVISTQASEILVDEMFHRLNEIIDIRGDRISLASQRLFDTLRGIALFTSIIFLLPFYFVGFTDKTQILDEILIAAVTLLVIFIYLIIEDLDEPFGGKWKIEPTSWERLLKEMDSEERKIELGNLTNEGVSISSPGKATTRSRVKPKKVVELKQAPDVDGNEKTARKKRSK